MMHEVREQKQEGGKVVRQYRRERGHVRVTEKGHVRVTEKGDAEMKTRQQ